MEGEQGSFEFWVLSLERQVYRAFRSLKTQIFIPLNSGRGALDSPPMQEIGKLVLIIGLVLVVVGAILWRFSGLFGWVGKLPGDISVQKGNFSFYFPVATCILISVVLTLLIWLFRR
jgi:Protein of unknown function (DUF2905)